MGDLTKNFSQHEFACPCCGESETDLTLVEILQNIRDDLGSSISISSGYRCEEHNRSVGGVDSSSHTKGLAVDIRCSSSDRRFSLIELALDHGITRIGVSSSFIHLDIDSNKPQMVIWTY